jgi:hypothetical protein
VIASTTVDVTATAAQNVNLKVSNVTYSNESSGTVYGNFVRVSATITNNSTTWLMTEVSMYGSSRLRSA